MIDRKYPTDDKFDPEGTKSQWQRFGKWVHYLNHHCDKSENIRYKVVFFGRHGQGYHNVAESFYGTPAWNVSIPPLPYQLNLLALGMLIREFSTCP